MGGSGGFIRKKQHFCAAKGGVAGGVDERVWGFEEADAEGALDLHVVAEGASEMDGAERSQVSAEALEEQAEAGGDGAFGKLQLANVGLVEDNGRRDGEDL